MAEGATVYNITIDLADVDRGVYEQLELRVARHPSETAAYMLVRVLAYCLEYTEGIELTAGGVSAVDAPPVAVRDLTGRLTKWIDVGMPDADRLHRGSKLAGSVALYTHRDIRQVMAQFEGAKIHRADEIVIRAFDRTTVDRIADQLGRRSSFALMVSGGELTLSMGEASDTIAMTEHRLGTP